MGLCRRNDVSPSSEKNATDLITLKLRLNCSLIHSQNILGALNSCFTSGLDRGIQMMLIRIISVWSFNQLY